MSRQFQQVAAFAVLCIAAGVGLTSQAATAKPNDKPLTGGTVFVANEDSGSVSVIDAASDKVIATITGVPGPHNLQVSSSRATLWITSAPLNRVVVLDVQTYELLATIPVGNHPAHVILTPNGHEAYVTNSGDNTVSIIDPATLKVTATVPLGAMPHGARPSPDGQYVAVANMDSGTVSVISTATHKVTSTIAVGAKPVQVGFSSDGTALFVSLNQTGEVARIDTATWKVTSSASSGPGPVQLFVAADNSVVAVANQGTQELPGTTLKLFSPLDLKLLATITTGRGAHGVVIAPGDLRAYVTNVYDDTVSVIDLVTHTAVATISVGDAPNGISFIAGAPAAPASAVISLQLEVPTAAKEHSHEHE